MSGHRVRSYRTTQTVLEALADLGMRWALVSPGSRSTPLAVDDLYAELTRDDMETETLPQRLTPGPPPSGSGTAAGLSYPAAA